MKWIDALISLLVLAVPLISIAQETVPSRITEVTLYSNQAKITREATVQAKEGLNEFAMEVGADREVKVRREKVKDKIKETFFGKIQRDTIVRELAYKITLENLKNKAITIEIIDSIPVSRTDKIEVKDLVVTPAPKKEDYQDQEGVMLWEFDTNPGEKGEINIEFVITYPKDAPVFGL